MSELMATVIQQRDQARDIAADLEAQLAAVTRFATDPIYQHASTIDNELGCVHSPEDLRAGGVVPAPWDDDDEDEKFEPLPDHCLGARTVEPLLIILASTDPVRRTT